MEDSIQIVVVDDNEHDRFLALRELRKEYPKASFVEVRNAEELTDSLSGAGPDVVITDHQLHWTDGLAIFRETRDAHPGCPVIMFTGTGNEEVAVEAMKAGVDDYVLKSPAHYARLPQIVERVLKQASEVMRRKQAEEASRDSEGRYRQLFNTVADAVMVFDADTKQFVDVNDQATRLYGYTREEFLGLKSTDISSESEKSDAAMTRTLADEATRIPLRFHRRKDGTEFPVEIAGNVMTLGGRRLICGVVRDITKRRWAEDTIERERDFLETLYQTVGEAILNVRMPDRRISHGNSMVEAIFGYPPEEFVGQTTEMFYPDREKFEAFGAKLQDAMERGTSRVHTEQALKRKNGEVFPAEITTTFVHRQGELSQVISVVRDVSVTKLAEAALAESEGRFRAITDATPLPVAISRLSDGVILYANDAFAESIGLTRQELATRKTVDFFADPADRGLILEALKQDGQLLDRDLTGVRADGTVFAVIGSFQMMAFGGEPAIYGMFSDITERKRAEQELVQSREDQKRLTDGLRAVIDAVRELMLCPDLDSLFRRAVELAREELGVERGAIFVPEGTDHARGTYGTDGDGNVVPEYGNVIELNESWRTALGTWSEDVTQWWADETVRQEWDGEKAIELETGWVAMTPLVSGAHGEVSVGAFVNDSYLTKAPVDPTRQQILAVYCSMLAQVIRRKEAEGVVRESEERYRELFDNMRSGVAVYRAVDDGEDFVFEDLNAAGQRIDQTDRADLIGRSVLEAFPGVRELGLFEVFQRVWQTGEPERHPTSLYQDNRLWHWVENYVYRLPSGEVVAVYEDVTQQKRSQENVKLLSDVTAQVTDSILLTDRNFKIVYINEAAERLFGYQVEELVGLTPEVLNAEPLAAEIQQEIYEAASSGGGYFGKWLNRRKDGSTFTCELKVSHLRDEKGEITGYVGVQRDVTERERAARELEEANRRLEEALANLEAAQEKLVEQERLRAVGVLASGVAHDFNNALATIHGLSEMLATRPELRGDKAKVERYATLIHREAEDAADVVNRLSDFYREREPGEVFTSVNLNRIVQQAIELASPSWKDQAQGRDATISLESDLEDVPFIRGNESELRQAIANLILNAVDSMEESGTIALRTRAEADAVILEVSDPGKGMTEEVRQRCLDPFFTTKGPQGSGLGLSSVYGTVGRHDGEMEIESQVDEGTTVRIRLPRGRRAPETKMQTPAPESTPAREFRILLADDEPSLRTTLSEFLKGDGHTVETAVDGPQALELFEPGRFDLVITDQSMPGMSGDRLARELKDREPGLPIILITGFAGLLEDDDRQPEGVDRVLGKPVKFADLRRAMAELSIDY